MSEVLGTVLLTAMTVMVLGGFSLVVLGSLDDADRTVAGAFTLDARAGDDHALLAFVDGSPFALDSARVVLLVNGTESTGALTLVQPDTPGVFAPGGALRIALASGTLPPDARLQAFVFDLAGGEQVGAASATLVPRNLASPLLSSTPGVLAAAADPTVLVVDGASVANLSVEISSTFGRDLVRSVTVDLSRVGGPAAFPLADDGRAPDEVAGDGVYAASITASAFGFASVPAQEAVVLPVTVEDVLGNTASGEVALTLESEPQSRVVQGARYRDLPTSDTVRWVNLTRFTINDPSKLANDQVQVRVADLVTGVSWTALVSFGDPTQCGGSPGVTSIKLTREGVAGDATYAPAPGPCFPIGALAHLNLADIPSSFDAAGLQSGWTATGDPALFSYAAANLGATNEAVVTFVGDSVSPAPTATGFGEADLIWARVVANNAPVASFSLTSSLTSLAVQVDGSPSTDADGHPLTYVWSWGDGTTTATAGVPTASHTYPTADTYTLRLTVTDSLGASGTTTRAVTVNRAPVASFTSAAASLTASFDSAASQDPDGQAVTRAWTFGDGSTAGDVVAPTRTYAAPGTYTVTLTVTDSLGVSSQSSSTVTLSALNVGPTSTLGANVTSGAAPLDVRFALAGSDPDGSVASWSLAYGDGGTASGTTLPATVDKKYLVGGTYAASLTVTDNAGATHTSNLVIGVNARPAASFLVTSTAGLVVGVDASASTDTDGTVATYRWDWGDGATSDTTGPLASRTYATGGTYTVGLVVVDNQGAESARTTRTVTPNRAPVVTALTATALDQLNATLGATASDPDGDALTYAFAWGDATAATLSGATPSASHAYATPGNYTVTVYANDTRGASHGATLVVAATSTHYALLTTTDAGTPGGTVTNAQNVQALDGASMTLAEANGAGAGSSYPTSSCDRVFDGCATTGWTLVTGTFSAPTISGAGTGSTLAGGTSGNALQLATSGAGPNGLRTGSYRVQWTQAADASAGTGAFNMGYRFATTTAGQSVAMALVAPNGAVTNLGSASVANANWNAFPAASIPTSVSQQGGTFTLFANVTVDKNANVLLDDLGAAWSAFTPFRAQKQMSVPNLPGGALSHHLEITAALGANPETLNVLVEGPAGTWTQRGAFTSTTPSTVVYRLAASDIIAGAVNVRLVDATTTGDAAQSTWSVDAVRVVVRG